MDKNSIIGFILIAAIFIGFSMYQSGQMRKQAELQAQLDSVARAESLALELAEAERLASLPDSLKNAPVAPAEPRSIYKDSSLEAASHAEAQIVALENDKLRVEFTTKGAQPWTVQVKDYKNYDSTDLYLFKPGAAEYSVSLYSGEYIRTKDFSFEVAERTDSTVVMRLPFAGGGYIEQKYTLRAGSYCVDNLLSFVGMQGVIPRNVSSFDLDFDVTMPRMEKGYKNESQYSKLDYYFEGDRKPVEIGRGRNASRRVDSKLSWFAFQQQFFSAILRAPQQFASGELSVSFLPENDPERNLMTCSAKMRADLPAGGEGTVPFEFYFGPNHYKTLKDLDQKYEKIIPLGGWLVGWFTKYAIIPMFNFFHRFISSFGLIILLMTLVIKLVVFPLTYKSYASSAKMSALKPELDKINAKYPHADNQQEMMKKQQATMDLYKRAGVSPMGGCLPTLLTFPILWAMFRFFPASIELRQQPFLWCHDLSAYDSIVDFGTRVPLIGDHISLFALLMAVTMWGYSKMTMANQPAAANDPNAASMRFMSVWMMPIMMFFICNSLSAALSYYYLLSQLISIVQTWAIRKSINKDEILAKVRASAGKPVQKSKWQQRLEEAQRMQEQQMRQQQKRK
ncbi:MAG: membrane protein insertase YidC [Bacteroidales bacterium]|nr:membrane protein insertase YidC [Bacteroidales bacterium]MDO5000173.1 membrane protein insertase YidC [Bacteroidales bacterium]